MPEPCFLNLLFFSPSEMFNGFSDTTVLLVCNQETDGYCLHASPDSKHKQHQERLSRWRAYQLFLSGMSNLAAVQRTLLALHHRNHLHALHICKKIKMDITALVKKSHLFQCLGLMPIGSQIQEAECISDFRFNL